jgi:ESS family glutamate:Na+ symporter
MSSEWSYVVDVALLSLFLGIALYLKRSVRWLQKFLVPTSIIAGFIGLFASQEVLGLVKLDGERMGNIIYHLMAIGFIALALKERKREKSKAVINTGLFIVSTYVIQGILGFALSLMLFYSFFPGLFPPFGLILPLAYGQGPGQAYSIGRQWESLGFTHGGNIGLSMAAFGFIWACIGGVPLMNYLLKKKRMKLSSTQSEAIKENIHEEDSPDDMPLSDSIDKISIQLFMIGIVYLATYLSLKGASALLVNLGTFGQTLSQLLWGFNFIIGALFAILLRVIFDFFKKKNIMIRNYPNNYLLSRISGGCFDFMVTASIAAISISILREYFLPVMVITTLGGMLTIFYIVILSKKVYKTDVLENLLALYGMLTGTISTGLALLREVDPNFRTKAAKNLVLGSGVGLFAGFPLMLILNIPIVGYVNNQPLMYFITLGALAVYLVVLLAILLANRER